MTNVYTSFLRSPSAAALAANASLHYITTSTTLQGADAILKHIEAQDSQIQKKEEKVIHSTEGNNGVCVETETVLVFKQGGGVILPKMDDNMLADVTVVFPMVCQDLKFQWLLRSHHLRSTLYRSTATTRSRR